MAGGFLGNSLQQSLLSKNNNEEETKKLTLLNDGYYYDVTNFAKIHPGRELILMYLNNGEDATHAIQQFHFRSTKKVNAILNSLPKRKATEEELVAIHGEDKLSRHRSLTSDFNALFAELVEEGLFEPCIPHVVKRYLEIVGLVLLGHFLACNGWGLLGVVFISWGLGRSGWFVHEAGHHSFTGKPNLERLIQSHVYGVFGGLSAACWRNHHSKHHAMPQHVKYDVDLQTLPIMAFHTTTVTDPNSQFNFFIKYQKWVIYIVHSTIVGLWWKYVEDPLYAWRHGEYLDLFHMALHQLFIFQLGLPLYFLVVVIVFSYLGINTTLSHTHMEVTEEPTHWVEFGLVHTANVRSSWWVDYFMGYLNYQIEHHLFPTMPQFRNKLASARVKALAKRHNLPYHLYDFKSILIKTVKNLGSVSDEIEQGLKKLE